MIIDSGSNGEMEIDKLEVEVDKISEIKMET